MAKKKKKWLSNRIIYHKDPTYFACPKCGKVNVLKRSRPRSIMERVIKTTTIYKLYRCHNCGWRGYRSTIMLTWQSFLTFFMYIALALAAAFIVLQVIKRTIGT